MIPVDYTDTSFNAQLSEDYICYAKTHNSKSSQEKLEKKLEKYDGTLEQLPVKWKNQSSACVILASGGYPVKYEK